MAIDIPQILRNSLDGGRTARKLVFKGANLRGQRLLELRGDELDFEEADLLESVLRGVKWKSCNLHDARLDAADLTNAVLRMCDLDGVRAIGATFLRARIENCTARGARFDNADMTGAVLTDTDFSRASLCGAKLECVEASGTSFRGADLRGAMLKSAILTDADLRGADLTDADLTDADLRGADLRGVVGDNPALPKEDDATAQLPAELNALSGTIAPIVSEVLQTAGRQGVIDAKATEKLTEDIAALQQATSPKNAPHAETLKAVTRVLDVLGSETVPTLFAALSQPSTNGPPPEVTDLLLRLRRELGMAESTTTEEILERLTKGQ